MGLLLALVIGIGAFVQPRGAGHSGGARITARVGGTSLSAATVEHWMAILAPRHIVPDAPRYEECVSTSRVRTPSLLNGALREGCGRRYRRLKTKALEFLISREWLIGQAAQEGVQVSPVAVQRGVRATEASYQEGRRGFENALHAAGETIADTKLEVAAELAEAALKKRLKHRLRRVKNGEVDDYYRAHRARFFQPEQRQFYIVEFIEGRRRALRLQHEIELGKLRVRDAPATLLELRRRPAVMRTAPKIIKAIFAATPGAVTSPVHGEGRFYFLLDVVRVQRARQRPLHEVASAIRERLSRRRFRRALEAYIRAWRKRWTARTECMHGYYVRKCRGFRGARVPESPVTFS